MTINTTKETVYFLDQNYARLYRWVDITKSKVIEAWTFVRPYSNIDCSWKVYMVTMGETEVFPISATNLYWLWKKLSDHSAFKFFLTSYSKVTIYAEAWSTGGVRLPKEDVTMEGTKVVLRREEPVYNLKDLLEEHGNSTKKLEIDGVDAIDKSYKDEEDFAKLVENSLREAEEFQDYHNGCLVTSHQSG